MCPNQPLVRDREHAAGKFGRGVPLEPRGVVEDVKFGRLGRFAALVE